MRQSSLIGHTIEIYSKYADNPEKPADSLIRQFFYERKYLGAKDRRFIADAYFGTIKNKLRCEALATDATGDRVPHRALIVAAYLIANAGVAPQSMQEALKEINLEFPLEVFEAMGDRMREVKRLSALDPATRLSIGYSYPRWFVERLTNEYGIEEVESILEALNDEAPTVLRVNKLVLNTRDELRVELENEGCESALSMIAPDALVLPKRVNVMGLSAFKRGAFEVQDEASQLVAPFASIEKSSLKVLDACAGAGGKTLHLAALLRNKGEIFATDVEGYKLEELKRRVKRSTAQNVRIVMPDQKPKVLGESKKEWFDLVLLDVPCSGTGTLRRNPGIKWVLTEQMVAELMAKQRSILAENIPYLKPGGKLVYATCSILREEGEDQAKWILDTYPGQFELEQELRTRPDKEGCDGFFAARFRKL